jgi:hypothetical protein
MTLRSFHMANSQSSRTPDVGVDRVVNATVDVGAADMTSVRGVAEEVAKWRVAVVREDVILVRGTRPACECDVERMMSGAD